MRVLFVVAACLAVTACSDSSTTETKTKEEPKSLEPITGRQAFQSTYPSARAWAPDCQPFRIRSLNLTGIKPSDGKAGAWEIMYVSESRAAAKAWTWSATEGPGSLHQGVFSATGEQSWRGPTGQERPFPAAALSIDTPEALKTATENSKEYLSKPGEKPPVTFILESTARFGGPVWRVLWGESVSTAQHSVFVNASTGGYLGLAQ
jgi:hypothetical protein